MVAQLTGLDTGACSPPLATISIAPFFLGLMISVTGDDVFAAVLLEGVAERPLDDVLFTGVLEREEVRGGMVKCRVCVVNEVAKESARSDKSKTWVRQRINRSENANNRITSVQLRCARAGGCDSVGFCTNHNYKDTTGHTNTSVTLTTRIYHH